MFEQKIDCSFLMTNGVLTANEVPAETNIFLL